jgi:xanthine dehydrogenase small subunit
MPEIRFTLNGAPHVAKDIDPNTTLLDYLRNSGRTGTKEGCGEGECGACAVALVARAPDGTTRYEAVNSCLLLAAAVAGREVVTVEGVARESCLHPCQDEMARAGGSQCGYCTPGFVVSFFAEYYRAKSGALDEESIAGNLCRCTGYRPIREAGERLAQIREKEVATKTTDPHRARLSEPLPPLPAVDYAMPANGHPSRRFVRPTSLLEACRLRATERDLVPLSGGTDLVVELNQRHRRLPGVLSLEGVPELKTFENDKKHLAIGAGISLAELEERLHSDKPLGDQLVMLKELLPLFSSRLIRTRATFGGNLGTASPIGDGPPALLALGAELVLAKHDDQYGVSLRFVPLDQFFLDYRKTALEPGEIIAEVRIPKPFPEIQRFYKVSKRRMDDISTVAAGFVLDLDPRGVVTRARFAYGGVAATPKRASRTEVALVGQTLSAENVARARTQLASEFAPIDDHRGSGAYRRAMVLRLYDKFFAEIRADELTEATAPTRGGAA